MNTKTNAEIEHEIRILEDEKKAAFEAAEVLSQEAYKLETAIANVRSVNAKLGDKVEKLLAKELESIYTAQKNAWNNEASAKSQILALKAQLAK